MDIERGRKRRIEEKGERGAATMKRQKNIFL